MMMNNDLLQLHWLQIVLAENESNQTCSQH